MPEQSPAGLTTMASTGSIAGRPRTSRTSRLAAWLRDNRIGLLALTATGSVLWTLSWWHSLHAPQRLGDLPAQTLVLGFHRGDVVSTTDRSAITLRPVQGRPARTLLNERLDSGSVHGSSPRGGQGAVTGERVVEQGLLYYTYDMKSMTGGPMMGGRSVGQPIRVEYRRVTLAELGQLRPIRDKGNYSAWLLPFSQGATPVRIADGLNNPSVALSGDFAYWVEGRHWPTVPVSLRPSLHGNVWHIPILPPCSRLMRMRLAGAANRIPEALQDSTSGNIASAGKSGVVWTEPEYAARGAARVLCYLRNDGREPVRLDGFLGTELPVEHNQRLYWLQPERPEIPVGYLDPMNIDLMSVANDLTGIRIEASVKVCGAPRLLVHGKSALLICNGEARLTSDSRPLKRIPFGMVANQQGVVYEVTPGPRCSLSKLAEFPRGVRRIDLDGDDLYAVVEETRENWFDWSKSGLIPQASSVLYRYHLPH